MTATARRHSIPRRFQSKKIKKRQVITIYFIIYIIAVLFQHKRRSPLARHCALNARSHSTTTAPQVVGQLLLGSGALIIAIETVCLSASRVVDMLSSTTLNSLERCQCGMLKCWCFKEGSQHTCWAHWIFCKLAGSRLKPSGNAKLQLARDSGPMVSMRLCCRCVFSLLRKY